MELSFPPVRAQSHAMTGESDISSSGGKQRLMLVTGLLGAGKTTALKVLEDLGWEVIDNFPIRMLDGLIDSTAPAGGELRMPLAVGFDTRTRGFDPHKIIARVKTLTRRGDLELTTLFLDCSGKELERRYNETRRRHPLADDMPVAKGIAAERELLEPLRRWADMVIDTTEFAVNELQQVIRERFAPSTGRAMTVTVSSFGFSRGMPPVADLVFDMRFLDNPHWVDELRPKTGLDEAVVSYVMGQTSTVPFLERLERLLSLVMPLFVMEGKAYLTVAFGCTGGHHRSVVIAEQVATQLRRLGYEPTVTHRDIDH
jgi:UPF0042 nucleotide-binding protein